MIPLLALMVGVYIISQSLATIARLVPRSEPLKAAAVIFAVAAIVTTVLCAAQIVLMAEQVEKATAEALRAADGLLR